MRGQVYNVPRGLVWNYVLDIAERERERRNRAEEGERESTRERERGGAVSLSLSQSTLIMRTVLNITEFDFQKFKSDS